MGSKVGFFHWSKWDRPIPLGWGWLLIYPGPMPKLWDKQFAGRQTNFWSMREADQFRYQEDSCIFSADSKNGLIEAPWALVGRVIALCIYGIHRASVSNLPCTVIIYPILLMVSGSQSSVISLTLYGNGLHLLKLTHVSGRVPGMWPAHLRFPSE